MKILLDHCVPRDLKAALTAYEVFTTCDMGWDRLKNGSLLKAAGGQFDVFITVDRSIRHEQNLAKLPIAVILLRVHMNDVPLILACVPMIETELARLQPRRFVEIDGRA